MRKKTITETILYLSIKLYFHEQFKRARDLYSVIISLYLLGAFDI